MKMGQKLVQNTFGLLLTYFQGSLKPTFGPAFDHLDFSGIFGASRRTRAI